jgi:hypothetical protein
VTQEKQYPLTEETRPFLPTIQRIEHAYSVSLREMRSHSRTLEAIDARLAVANALRGKGLSYRAIGEVINRDHSSVRYLLKRRDAVTGKRIRRNPDAAVRSDLDSMSVKAMRAGSAALLKAIFATGKVYRPMSLAEQLEATEWIKKAPPLKQIGWME